MTEQKVHYVTLEMSSLDECSQRELNAYRNLGTLREFRRLKHQEMHRRERRQRIRQITENIYAGFVFAACLCLILVLLISL